MTVMTAASARNKPYALIRFGKGKRAQTALLWIGAVRIVQGNVRTVQGKLWDGAAWVPHSESVPAAAVLHQWRVPPRAFDLKRAQAKARVAS